MNILAFETSTAACSVALSYNGNIINEHVIQARGHANLILTMIEALLSKAKLTLPDVNIISFGQGPGSFTGLRIAAGVCQGIAYSHDTPVVALSSLRILAQGVFRETQEKNIAILQDARMSEIYWGCYSENNGIMKLIASENVSKPEHVTLPQLGSDKNWYSVGEAWLAYKSELNLIESVPALQFNAEFNHPNAIDMITLAQYEFNNGNSINAEDINPIYLRNNVAFRKKEEIKT